MQLNGPVEKRSMYTIRNLGQPTIPSPVQASVFIDDGRRILENPYIDAENRPVAADQRSLEIAGPRKVIYFDPSKTKAAIVTCGGLSPGINDVIRAVVMELYYGYGVKNISGIRYGFQGLIPSYGHPLMELTPDVVKDFHLDGGSKLASSRGSQDIGEMVDSLRRLNINLFFCIGGDGTMKAVQLIAEEIERRNLDISVVGIPKTIDNDVFGTDFTFGFDSAVNIATDAIDRLHTTANSHKRIMVIELMGHTAGWLTLYAGMAGGGDVILLPELGYDMKVVNRYLRDRAYKKKPYSIVVVAEGIEKPKEEASAAAYVAKIIEKGTHIETRTTILGYVQRGGSPSPMDRILATRFGSHAVQLIAEEKFGRMVTNVNGQTSSIPLKEVAGKLNLVPKDHSLIRKARALDICMGDFCEF